MYQQENTGCELKSLAGAVGIRFLLLLVCWQSLCLFGYFMAKQEL